MGRIIICPNCKFKFDIMYGRAFACSGCSSAVIHQCDYAKCPKCKLEFPLSSKKTNIGTGTAEI